MTGPIEDVPWPERLSGRVVDRASPSAINGYEVAADLATFYRFSDVLHLVTKGELPADESHGVTIDALLTVIAPCDVGEMPTHAALLARLCDGTPTSIIGVGATCLAEAVTASIQAVYERTLDWLRTGAIQHAPPELCHAAGAQLEEAPILPTLRLAVRGKGYECPIRASFDDLPLRNEVALVVALHELGIHDAEAMIRFAVTAKLPTVLAEAWTVRPRAFKDYPMRLPDFRYEAP